MLLLKAIEVVFPVFSIIGLGYLFARFKKISLEPIIEVLLYLTVPALVISSLLKRKLVAHDLAVVSLSAAAVILGTGLLAFAYLKYIRREDLRGFYLPVMFMNSGNMAFPLALLAFGVDGLAVAILYYVAVSVMVYSLGIYVAKGRSGLREIFRLPLIYAAGAGIVLNLNDLTLPGPVLTVFDMLGAATIPLMQIGLGYSLNYTRLTHYGISFAGTALRICGGVAIAWAVVTVLGIEGLNKKVIILSSGMPAAVINFVLSRKYNVDSELVSSTVALSTLASVVTTPLILMWIM